MKSSTSFDIHAGRLVLNFTNTVEERPGYDTNKPSSPIELLNSPERALSWCEAVGVLDHHALSQLRRAWGRDHKSAALCLERLITLREELFGLLLGIIQRGALRECDIDFLNCELAKLPPQMLVKDTASSLTLGWRDEGDAGRRLVAAIVSDAVLLITSSLLERMRVCAAKDCGWLFLDTSKNGKRRWCDMSDCGNREKQRRFQMNEKRG